MDVDTFRLIYRVALITAGIASVAVPIVYQKVSEGKWRDSTLGKHLMGSDSIIAGIFIFSVIATLTDYPRVELAVGAILFFTFAYLRFSRSRLMLQARKVRDAEQKYGITEEELS